MTAWELLEEIQKYLEGRDDKVVKLMTPVAQWALMASCRGSTGDQSAMAYVLPPVAMPSKELQKRMKQCLNTTLGKRTPPRRQASRQREQQQLLASRFRSQLLGKGTGSGPAV